MQKKEKFQSFESLKWRRNQNLEIQPRTWVNVLSPLLPVAHRAEWSPAPSCGALRPLVETCALSWRPAPSRGDLRPLVETCALSWRTHVLSVPTSISNRREVLGQRNDTRSRRTALCIAKSTLLLHTTQGGGKEGRRTLEEEGCGRGPDPSKISLVCSMCLLHSCFSARSFHHLLPPVSEARGRNPGSSSETDTQQVPGPWRSFTCSSLCVSDLVTCRGTQCSEKRHCSPGDRLCRVSPAGPGHCMRSVNTVFTRV